MSFGKVWPLLPVPVLMATMAGSCVDAQGNADRIAKMSGSEQGIRCAISVFCFTCAVALVALFISKVCTDDV